MDAHATRAIMIDRRATGAFARMFGSAVVVQALLSATSLCVGLILIRRVSDEQYGFYVLTLNVVMLVTSLQNSFIQSHMVVRMTGATEAARANLIGGLYREQRKLLPLIALAAAVITMICGLTGIFNRSAVYVALVGILAVLAALYREFLRMVLLAYRLPDRVLKGDLLYAAVLIGGVWIAASTPRPAVLAGISLAAAAVACGSVCQAALWRFKPWNIHGSPGILREIAPLGAWTATASAIHWLFSQGYNFLVAGTLGVTAVAAIAATRILIMPVNLLSSGIGTLMLPTVSNWLQTQSAPKVLKRQFAIAGGMCIAALAYFGVLWLVRDWLFVHILKKQLESRDQLLLLWFGVGLLMLMRDQLLYLLLSRSRFRSLTVLTFLSAVISLATSYFGMRLIGPAGALVGVLMGELVNVSGLVILSFHEIRKPQPALNVPASAKT
jgi:O-antigen/teichoic acid export membrane protein